MANQIAVDTVSGEVGEFGAGSLPGGWAPATAAQIAAHEAAQRHAALTTTAQQLLAAGETALGAATFGAYEGDLERRRAFAEESPILHAAAGALPGLAVGAVTGGAGLALGAAAAVGQTMATADEQERDAEWGELAASGLLGGLAGPLMGRVIGRAAGAATAASGAAAARGADALADVVQGSVGRQLARATADVAEVLPHVRGGTAQRALSALDERIASTGQQLVGVADEAAKLTSLRGVGGQVPAAPISIAATRRLSDALSEAVDAGVPGERLRGLAEALAPQNRVSQRAVWQRAARLAEELGEDGAGLRAALASEELAGPAASRLLAVGERLAAGETEAGLQALAGLELPRGTSDKIFAALKAHAAEGSEVRRLQSLRASLAEAAAAGERQSASLQGLAASAEALAGPAALAFGGTGFAITTGAAKALKLLANQQLRDVASRLTRAGGAAAGRALEGQAASAARLGQRLGAAAGASAGAFAAGFANVDSAFDAREELVQRLADDPGALALELDDAMQALPASPGGQAAGAALTERMAVGLAHLRATMPARVGGSLLNPRGSRPSRTEIATWGERFEAVLDPIAALERVAAGRASPAVIETLRAVHPGEVQGLADAVFEAARGGSIDARKAGNLAALLGLDGVLPQLQLAPAQAPSGAGAPPAPNPLAAPKATGST
jgi:hypothetical protein